MAEMILHEYAMSPFSEKVRLVFGLKGLAWRSVEVPIWMPKPLLTPLTGGYRRAPVMQIGADIFCDTQLILREIERRRPEPTLYPGGQVGLASALAWWFETVIFAPAASLATSVIGDRLPAEFIEERRAFMNHDFSKERSLKDLPVNRGRVCGALAWLIDIMKDGRPFMLGDSPSAADLAAYHMLWFARKNGGATVEAMLPLAPLQAWMDRIAAFGHGERRQMTGEDALTVARMAEPEPTSFAPGGDPSGFAPGDAVVVRADDRGRDPVRGTLVGADAERSVIRREAPETGPVHVHFPRVGFDMTAT